MKKVPHTYVIIFFIIILCSLLTLIIPAGEFDRQQVTMSDGSTRELVLPDSFHYTDKNPQLWEIFTSFYEGFVAQSHIIIFILLIGGAFWIMNATKVLNVGIAALVKVVFKLEKNKWLKKIGVNNVIMLLIMTVFSLFGAIFGMSEETIAFIIIFVPLFISMGYDSITGVCVVYVAAHLGFAGAVLNPFTIGIAQGIAEIPLFSGMGYRILCWLIINAIGFTFILIYANKVKKHPEKSVMYKLDGYWRESCDVQVDDMKYYTPTSAWICWGFVSALLIVISCIYPETTMAISSSSLTFPALPIFSGLFILTSFFALRKSVHFYIINMLIFTVFFLIIGVMVYGWYVKEIGSLFFAMGIFAGLAVGNSANVITRHFLDGAKDILSAALVVGLAGGIIIILQKGQIIDTIMYSLTSMMKETGKVLSLGAMYCIQTALNLIMPSGSAKAALTMPIMTPFSDLLGISRQATVLAFQFGDGFTNMITPTSGVLMGCLGMAKIPYNLWLKFFWKFILFLIVIGFVLLIPTCFLNLNGF